MQGERFPLPGSAEGRSPFAAAALRKEGVFVAFNTAAFLFFFLPAAFLIYRIIPTRRGRNCFLAAASLVFYACGQWQGLPCLLASAILSGAAGRLLPHANARKPLLAFFLAMHLLMLGAFKYLGFFTVMTLSFPLPVGISFFTFKAMAYTIDVYRGGCAAAGNFGDLLLYLSFFPQVTSGPIARFGPFAAQLEERPFHIEQTAKGFRRFIAGFAKKVLIAGLVSPVADSAFSLGGDLDFRLAWLGAAAYTIQLYFDFSGYSDMAIGLGGVFGFETPENFEYPYISSSITEFWRRWHISLSSWFRDYLYIPLGGGHRGRARKCLNKMAVFLLCGLWHGANWTFVLWGAWHGVFSALESTVPLREWTEKSPAGRFLGHLYTLLGVCLGFVIFRASSAGEALSVFRAMFAGSVTHASTLALERIAPAAWAALAAGIVGSTPVWPWMKKRLGGAPLAAASYAVAAAGFVVCILAMAGSGFQPFIYSQF